ncbi:MAG: DUF2889 domain-containing protein, partial [Dehalococcoidia bacterium]|nr:DUF2889 domain-containing protein [Dehalococcoidia bacterium]
MFPTFFRNKHVGTENVADGLRIRTTLEETFFSAEVEVHVKMPSLEIASVTGQMRRGITPQCSGALAILHKVEGERVSEGLTKRVDDLIGRADGCTHMTNLVLESCHAAALGFRQVKMAEAEAQGLSHEDFYAEWVRTRPKELINSCVAFAEDSPLLARLRGEAHASPPRMRSFPQIQPGVLRFSRNKLLKVSRASQDQLFVRGILEDNAHSMMVELTVQIPQMEIVAVRGEMGRVPNDICPWALDRLQKAVGLRIAKGLTATVDEEIGRQGCPHMGNLLLESCHASIQGMLGVQLEESYLHDHSNWD